MDGPDSSGDERNEREMRDEMIGRGMREAAENRRQRRMEVKRSLRPRGWTGYLSDYLTAHKDSLCNGDPLSGGSRLKVSLGVETRPVAVTQRPQVSVRTRTPPPQECCKQSCVVPENQELEQAEQCSAEFRAGHTSR